MKIRLILTALAVLSAWPVAAAPPATIRDSVAICDPNNPANCLAPNTSGGLPGGGGGGGGSSGPATGAGSYTSTTVGSTSAQVAAAATRVFLDLKNESASQPIACSFGGTASLNTAGSFTIAPGGDARWESSFVPSDAVNCITSAGNTAPLTIGAH